MILRAAAILALIAACPAATAQTFTSVYFLDGNHLLQTCQVSDLIMEAYCDGYVVGAYEEAEASATPMMAICLPSNVTAKQMLDVTLKYLEAYPERRADLGSSIAVAALHGAFPCPQ